MKFRIPVTGGILLEKAAMLRFAITVLTILAAVGCTPRPARAQFIGFTSPQSVQQILATATACTGSAQNFNVSNLGQTQHYAYLTLSSGVTGLITSIEGLDASGNIYRISDQVIPPALFQPVVVTASGYFPIVRVTVTCTGGTFNVNYSGSSATANVNSGAYALGQSDKVPFIGTGQGATRSQTFQTPFINTAGKIYFAYAGTAIAGSTITIGCGSTQFPSPSVFATAFTIPIANSLNLQTFNVPAATCPLVTITYTTGMIGAVNTFFLEYIFTQPALINPAAAVYTHIAGTTATAAKNVGGILTTLTIGTPAAGTVTLHDLAVAACTAVPATEIVGVFTAVAGSAPQTYPLNLVFNQGICVKASAVMDITVGTQ